MERKSNYYSSWVRKKTYVMLLNIRLLAVIVLSSPVGVTAINPSGGEKKAESVLAEYSAGQQTKKLVKGKVTDAKGE